MYDVSILLPGIRKNNWITLYNSINLSEYSFELILVGPYDPPDELLEKDNFKFIKDFGAPVRATQIAFVHSNGKYVTAIPDDGLYIEGVLEKDIDYLENKQDGSVNDMVINKYYELGNLLPDKILFLNNAYPRSSYIPDNWYIFNLVVMYSEFFRKVGGYDCEYETTALAHADLAARSQCGGAKVFLIEKPMVTCTHMPGTAGDHAPVHYGHLEHDEGLYMKKYCFNDRFKDNLILDVDNWKNSPSIWRRRFPES